jgi:hypothetical protein
LAGGPTAIRGLPVIAGPGILAGGALNRSPGDGTNSGAAAMTPGPRDLFVEVLSAAADPPEALRSHAHEVSGCEESAFDESYLEFLDEQIRLGPRGPEWTERLERRRAGLEPFCGVRMVSGHVRAGTSGYTVYIDPRSRAVVYWEEYPEMYSRGDGSA